MGPAKASTAHCCVAVQYEPGSQSRSRVQAGTAQWPVEPSQANGAVQPVLAQPGTQAPAEQMVVGAPGHSESPLQLMPVSSGGQSARAGSQQWPEVGLQRRPSAQPASVQPPTHTRAAGLQTVAGGSQSSSSLQAGAPEHSPVAGA